MNILPNSVQARDIASQVHPQTNLRSHIEIGPQIIARGDGIRVLDEEGKNYIDTVSGLWCAALGFSANERIAKVAFDQIQKLGYYHSYRHQANEPSIELAEMLLRLAPVPMSKVLFFSSGSEANDTAIKLCWYYHHAIGKPEKKKIIGRQGGYHGSTIGAISVSGKPDMHSDFNLPLPNFHFVDMPHYYRYSKEGETEEQFANRLAEQLEQLILLEGPETVAAFFAEPVMGGGGGIIPPKTYFEKIQAVLRKYEVLFIADEVVCGFGRTGNWWGSQTFDLNPDMISCAKALSAAFQPISALMVNEKIFDAMLTQSDKLGSFAHGSTYSGHPVASAVAREVVSIYHEQNMIEHAASVGEYLFSRLKEAYDHPMVGDVNGVGLLTGIELVADKTKRSLYPTTLGVGKRMDNNGKKNGLILRVIGDRIVFAPPLVVTISEIDETVERFQKTLDDTYNEIT